MTTFPRRVFLGAVWTVVWVLATLLVSPAHARTVYVRQSGDDARDGSSPAAAVRTIVKGASLAAAGDTVLVGPGIYLEGDIRLPTVFGRVRFQADRRGTAVGDPAADVVVDATGFSAGFEFNGHLAMAVDGFVVYGATNGIHVKSGSHSAVVSNNIVCNNRDNGISVTDSRDAVVFNNLVYNNRGTGILISGTVQGSSGAEVLSNTVYRNIQRGIFFSSQRNASSPNGLVLNNIVQENDTAGIQVNLTSRTGFLSAGNVSFDNPFVPDDVMDVTDLEADPYFVDPSGADEMLGGAGYADDDFHLSQERAGQASTSPAVDAGSDLARRLNLLRASTRTDARPDRGIVDSGYHYGNFGAPPAEPEQRLRFKKIWVSVATGDDANDGGTRETAVRTLKHAFDLARPGHMISIAGGTYDEGPLSFRNSGKPRRPIVIKALSGARIAGRPGESGLLFNSVGYVVVDGLHVTGAGANGIEINFSQPPGSADGDNIVLRRVRLTANARGLAVKSSTGVRLISSVVDGNRPRGVQIEAAAVSIERSTIRNSGDSGVWAFGGSSVAISDTHMVANRRDGVLVEQSDVSIVRGSIQGSLDGGARFKKGSTGTLEDVDILDNTDVGVQVISSVVSVTDGDARGNGIGLQAFVDPVDQLPVELTVDGSRVCDNRGGPGIDVRDTALTVTSVDLCANGREGIRQRGGTLDIADTKIRLNTTGGISVTDAQRVSVQASTIERNQQNGIQIVRVEAASVEDSVVHHSAGDGLMIFDSPSPQVVNNLVYANGDFGIVISGNTVGSPDAVVVSNTIYDNANRGLVVGGDNFDPPSPYPFIMRNIFHGNGRAGIQVNTLSQVGYRVDYNLSTDPYGANTEPGINDILGVDPLFVNPDAGDFHLSQTAAGQSISSPAVDAGDQSAAAAGMDTKTTRSDNVADRNRVDLGYHYFRVFTLP